MHVHGPSASTFLSTSGDGERLWRPLSQGLHCFGGGLPVIQEELSELWQVAMEDLQAMIREHKKLSAKLEKPQQEMVTNGSY